MSRPAFTPAERTLIGDHCSTVIDNFECAGLAISDNDRERTLLALDAASSALGTLVFQLKNAPREAGQ